MTNISRKILEELFTTGECCVRDDGHGNLEVVPMPEGIEIEQQIEIPYTTMTKVIILGEPAEKKEGKKIEFVKAFVHQMEWINCTSTPRYWKNIELICKNYNKSSEDPYDLMYVYDDERNMGIIYLGHFNDGIV